MSRKYKTIILFLWFITLGFNVVTAAIGAYCSLLTSLFPKITTNKKWKVVGSPLVLITVICLTTLVYCLTINTSYRLYTQYFWLLAAALSLPRLMDLAAEVTGLKTGSTIEHIIVWAGICVYMVCRVLPLDIKTLAIMWECNKYPLFFMAATLLAGLLYSHQTRKAIKKKPEVFDLTQDLHKSFLGTPSHPLYNKAKQQAPQPPAPPLLPKATKGDPAELSEDMPEQEKESKEMSEQTPEQKDILEDVTDKTPKQEGDPAELPEEAPEAKPDQEPDEAKPMSDQDNTKGWQHSEIGAAWEYIIKRYSNSFKREPEAWASIYALLQLIDTDEADVSSVRAKGHFDNSNPAFNALEKINLRRHTLNVLKATFPLVQKDSILEGTSLTAALIAAIGHDLGKLARFDDYVTGDHPLNSRKVVEPYINKLPNKIITNNILEAIEKHHVPELPNNIIHDLLRQADLSARNIEMQEVMGKNSPGSHEKQNKPSQQNNRKVITQTLHKYKIELPPDYPLDILMSKLREYANHPKTTLQKFWKSVSQPDGYIYMVLPLFDEIIREVAQAGNITDYDMARCDDKIYGAARMTAVYELLRENGFAHPLIKKGYFANTWEVQDRMYNQEQNLTLVAISAAATGAESIQALEEERHKIHRLKYVKICGLAKRD